MENSGRTKGCYLYSKEDGTDTSDQLYCNIQFYSSIILQEGCFPQDDLTEIQLKRCMYEYICYHPARIKRKGLGGTNFTANSWPSSGRVDLGKYIRQQRRLGVYLTNSLIRTMLFKAPCKRERKKKVHSDVTV